MENKTYTGSAQNISTKERAVSLGLGALILYAAWHNRSKLMAISGGIAAIRGIAGYCPLYDMMGKSEPHRHNINIRTSFVVNKPVAEVYSFWRKLENLPLFMDHLKSIKETGPASSHWVAKFPGGLGTISWNAVIVNEKKNEVLGWKSVANSAVDNAGKVEFTDIDPNTTGLEIVISYKAPFGLIGENIARFFTPAIEQMVNSDILNFRDYIENGFQKNMESDFRNELI